MSWRLIFDSLNDQGMRGRYGTRVASLREWSSTFSDPCEGVAGSEQICLTLLRQGSGEADVPRPQLDGGRARWYLPYDPLSLVV